VPAIPPNRATQPTESPERNRLPAALPCQEYARLLSSGRPVHLSTGHQIASRNQPFETVYFPRRAVVSTLVLTYGGWQVGRERRHWQRRHRRLELFLGDGRASEVVLVQIGGEAVSMSGTTFQAAVRESAPLQRLLQRYSLALMNQIVRTAGCNRMHSVTERCARWLLMSRHRVGRDEFRCRMIFWQRCLVYAAHRSVKRLSACSAPGSSAIDKADCTLRMAAVWKRGRSEDYRLSKAASDQIY
jgi:hypothetical protein